MNRLQQLLLRKKTYIFLYALFLFAVAVFVHLTLNSESKVKILEKGSEKEVEEIKPVRVTVVVDDGAAQVTYRLSKDAQLRNVDSVMDALQALRKGSGEAPFSYEKLEYTYGTEIDKVNGLVSPEGFKWGIFLGSGEVVNDIEDLKLENEGVYTIKLVEI